MATRSAEAHRRDPVRTVSESRMTVRAYPHYRNSGVEWLGDVPEHWEVRPLKRWVSLIQTGSTPPTQEAHYFEGGAVPWHGPSSFGDGLLLRESARKIAKSAIRDGTARLFDKESGMIVTIGATIGKVGFVDEPSSCNQQITAVTFDASLIAPKFGAYQLKPLEPMLRSIAPNTTLPILNQSQVQSLAFAAPPKSEQSAIAAFLDRETARIDALVDKIAAAHRALAGVPHRADHAHGDAGAAAGGGTRRRAGPVAAVEAFGGGVVGCCADALGGSSITTLTTRSASIRSK